MEGATAFERGKLRQRHFEAAMFAHLLLLLLSFASALSPAASRKGTAVASLLLSLSVFG